jgi:hypothetical protein
MTSPQSVALPKRFLNRSEISECMTYRDAVRLCYRNRDRQNMTQATFAEEIGAHAPHVSQWLHQDTFDKHGNRRPDLPADRIAMAEQVLGNHAISQYLMRLGMLTLMEEVISQRAA